MIALALPLSLSGADHKQPSVQPATTFAAVEVHAEEKVAIAAEPYDTKDKESLFKFDYLAHGIMPVRLIITNNGDRPINLRDARILFQTAQGDRIQASEPEDIERTISNKEKTKRKVPLPAPLPPVKIGPKVKLKDVEDDFNMYEYGALVVEAHSTRAGFLWYDVSELDHPLKGAKLHLHKLRNADGEELFYFEIPFDKYLQSKSTQMN
jgi:hypothetical protein